MQVTWIELTGSFLDQHPALCIVLQHITIMRPLLRANAPSAVWALRVPSYSHIYPCQSWRPVSLSSVSNTRSISAIRSGHIALNQNEGIIYINSEY